MISTEGHELQEGSATWVEEDASRPLCSRGILDYSEACVASRTVVIVHRNLEVPALKVGVRGSDPVAFAISPRNLEDVQWADEAVIWADTH